VLFKTTLLPAADKATSAQGYTGKRAQLVQAQRLVLYTTILLLLRHCSHHITPRSPHAAGRLVGSTAPSIQSSAI
jgi:hypothetical protein